MKKRERRCEALNESGQKYTRVRRQKRVINHLLSKNLTPLTVHLQQKPHKA
jgi:anionic cell wall polymer biosynthesis LytR-Cps2A-Psr (LCP) family protein